MGNYDLHGSFLQPNPDLLQLIGVDLHGLFLRMVCFSES